MTSNGFGIFQSRHQGSQAVTPRLSAMTGAVIAAMLASGAAVAQTSSDAPDARS